MGAVALFTMRSMNGLHHEMGQNGYAWTSDTIPGHYASAIYLPNVEVAHRLVEQFDLELLFIEDMKLI